MKPPLLSFLYFNKLFNNFLQDYFTLIQQQLLARLFYVNPATHPAFLKTICQLFYAQTA